MLKSPKELPKESTKASSRGKRGKAPAASKPEKVPEFFPSSEIWKIYGRLYSPLELRFYWSFFLLFSRDNCHIFPFGLTNYDIFIAVGSIGVRLSVQVEFFKFRTQLVSLKGEEKVVCIPVVVAVSYLANVASLYWFKAICCPLVDVVSPFPPSDKIGINSVQREAEEIVPMKQMKMDWVPYIPLEDRAALRHLKLERIKKYEYCLPYFYQPFKEDELEQSTIVQIIFPAETKPVFCEFDWELDELEEFTDDQIKEDELSEDEKDAFKDFVKEKVREAKKANREAREARKKAIEEMSEQTKAAFENMQFYKFYPVQTEDTPDVSKVMDPFINRYYGKAHKVL
ncbi:hypothetical protein HHK36_009404 [Tetracentron sinense]|uniref:Uncharacterized protein n=1 Tax=Tetracentron sinense TaxID=13715 RepID=A0A834ZBM0_TETSI|nr:hypothetical protein HHK36_009404 [Tetracentron sinense]